MKDKNIKIYAFYLPQFHETQENNIWWGKGFTEWDNVRSSKPLFLNHNQPRVPLNNNYYDLSDPECIAWQADLARNYGIAGFNIFHFWYSGVQLLKKPIELIRENEWIDIEYSLTWANHPWQRTWRNSDGYGQLLIEQTYEQDFKLMEEHYKYIFYMMSDPRYTRVDGKPLFTIYRTYDIKGVGKYLDGLREYINKELGSQIHINSMIQYPPKDLSFCDHIDSVSLFQPGAAMFNTDNLTSSYNSINNVIKMLKANLINAPTSLKSFLNKVNKLRPTSHKEFNYDDVWEIVLNQTKKKRYLGKPIIPGAFTDWDNTARYGKQATIFKGASPDEFKLYMEKLLKITKENDDLGVIFINAWNEWGESAYLEPDSVNGYSYLEVIKNLEKGRKL